MSNSDCFDFRCINCSIKIPVKTTNSLATSKVSRPVKTLPQHAINILRAWMQPAMLSPDNLLCLECFKQLHSLPESNNSDSIPERKLGHKHVCGVCGKSVTGKRVAKMPPDGPLREILLNFIPPQFKKEVTNHMLLCFACYQKARRLHEKKDAKNKMSQPLPTTITHNYIDDVCRTCLATGADKSVHNILSEYKNVNIFLYCLGVTIDPVETADKMPFRSVCSQCYDLLQGFHKFKSKALRIDSYFKSLNEIKIQKGVNTENMKDSRKSRRLILQPKLKEFSVSSDSDGEGQKETADINESSDTEYKTLLNIQQEVEEMLVEDEIEKTIPEAVADHTLYDYSIKEEYMETQSLHEEYEQSFDTSRVKDEIKIEDVQYLKTVPDNNASVPGTEIKDEEDKIKDSGVIKNTTTHEQEDEQDSKYDPRTAFHLQTADVVVNKTNKYKTNKDKELPDYEPESSGTEYKTLLNIKQDKTEMLVEDEIETTIPESVEDHTLYDSNIKEEYEQRFDTSRVKDEIKIEDVQYLKTVPDNNASVPTTEINIENKLKGRGVFKNSTSHEQEDKEVLKYDPYTAFQLQNAHVVINKIKEEPDYEPDKSDVETNTLRRTLPILESKELLTHPERSCLECMKKFKNAHSKRNHDKRKHFGGDNYFCKICKKTVKDKSNHNLKIHGITMYPFKCKKCKRKFVNEVNYLEHKASHTPASSFPCPVCKEIQNNFEEFKKHKAEAHPKDYKSIKMRKKKHLCHICSAQLHSKIKLEVHMRNRHTNVKLLKCETCGEEFSSARELNSHVLKRGHRAFKCDVCSKCFKSRSILHKHRTIVHCEVRKYSCQVCGVKFKTKSDTKQHEINVHKIIDLTKKKLQPETSES